MAQELLTYRGEIGEHLERVRSQVPKSVAAVRDRLLEHVRSLLGDAGATVSQTDLIREVAIAAERSDVAEEITRLASHLEQFEQIVRTENNAPGASSNSSSKRWVAKQTPSARKPMTSRCQSRSCKLRRRSKKCGS